jgi:transposase-like protein
MKKYSAEEKAMWLEDWKESGKSIWNYARENGLIPQTVYRWAGENTEIPQSFVEIKPPMPETARNAPEILIEKGGMKIHIPVAKNGNDLRTVIESLGCGL